MRDSNLIPEILANILKLNVADPNIRFMQLLINAIRPQSPCPELYYLEDEKLLERLQTDLKRYEERDS